MHAYLIMAHNEFDILEKCLLMLDDYENDFYIHIDKKVKKFDFDYYRNLLKFSNIYFIKRRNIQWGSFNIIRTEMDLFKAAYSKKYDVYHLISGSDLPIVNKKQIKRYFDNYPNTEFINIVKGNDLMKMNDRVVRFKYYHLFSNFGINKKGIRKLDNFLIKIQKKLRIDRFKNNYEFAFGSEWGSFSNEGVNALIKNEKFIYKNYRYTLCCDEIYKQTVLLKENLNIYCGQISNKRLIFWGENDDSLHPSIITMKNYEQIINSDCLFARKFSSRVDEQIVNSLFNQIMKHET